MPISPRTALGSPRTLLPPTNASPAVTEVNVVNILMVVVLPAPLGPSRLKTSPSSTANDTPSTTLAEGGKVFVSPLTSIILVSFPQAPCPLVSINSQCT